LWLCGQSLRTIGSDTTDELYIISYVSYGYGHGYSHGEMMVLYGYMTLVLHI